MTNNYHTLTATSLLFIRAQQGDAPEPATNAVTASRPSNTPARGSLSLAARLHTIQRIKGTCHE